MILRRVKRMEGLDVVDDNELILIESMKVLEIKDNDIVVLKTNEQFSNDAIDKIKTYTLKYFEQRGLKGIECMVLDNGMDIGVIRQGKSDGKELIEITTHDDLVNGDKRYIDKHTGEIVTVKQGKD
jgi:hypothetical protein